jgi:hypothetical protein
MFHGHTLVECQADEAMIMRLMSEPEHNKQRMGAFLAKVERECVPASLDCVPENASAITQSGVVQAQGLLTVDSQHWTPEMPERIGVYHAYIRGFNRDVRTHRLFIVCSGGMARASDAFCNMVIDGGRDWTAHVCLFIALGSRIYRFILDFSCRTSASRKRPGGSGRGAGGRDAGSSRRWRTRSTYPSIRFRYYHASIEL